MPDYPLGRHFRDICGRINQLVAKNSDEAYLAVSGIKVKLNNGRKYERFLLLLSFMTRIPMPKIDYDEEKLGKSMKLFPLVGIVIGFILLFFSIVFSYVLSNLSFSAFYQ